MRCPSCNSENPETTKFCGSCGAPLEAVCPNCGAENPPQFKFCGEWGTPLRKPRRSPEPARPRGSPLAQNILRDESGAGAEPADGERKTVTALFADIKGSTELMRDLDPEEARAIVDPALKLMIDATHRYDDLRRAIGVGSWTTGRRRQPKLCESTPGLLWNTKSNIPL